MAALRVYRSCIVPTVIVTFKMLSSLSLDIANAGPHGWAYSKRHESLSDRRFEERVETENTSQVDTSVVGPRHLSEKVSEAPTATL